MLDRRFIREFAGRTADGRQPDYREQLNIGVTGLGRSVGTTFVASSLAFFFGSMGKSVTFISCQTPSQSNGLLYDAAAMEQRFAHREFTDFYGLLREEKPLRGKQNRELGINWILPVPENWKKGLDLNQRERGRLIGTVRDELCVFDMETSEEWDPFLLDMDAVIVVVDPLPSKLIRHSHRFQMLKQMELSGCKMLWVVNKANSGISRRQTAGYLKNNHLYWIPWLDGEIFYGNETACRFHWEDPRIQRELLPIFTKISQSIGGL